MASEHLRRIGILCKSFPRRTRLAQTPTGKRNALLAPERHHQPAGTIAITSDDFQSDLDSTGTRNRVRNDRLLQAERPAMQEVASNNFRSRRPPVVSFVADMG